VVFSNMSGNISGDWQDVTRRSGASTAFKNQPAAGVAVHTGVDMDFVKAMIDEVCQSRFADRFESVDTEIKTLKEEIALLKNYKHALIAPHANTVALKDRIISEKDQIIANHETTIRQQAETIASLRTACAGVVTVTSRVTTTEATASEGATNDTPIRNTGTISSVAAQVAVTGNSRNDADGQGQTNPSDRAAPTSAPPQGWGLMSTVWRAISNCLQAIVGVLSRVFNGFGWFCRGSQKGQQYTEMNTMTVTC
jgi:hypothetical protein